LQQEAHRSQKNRAYSFVSSWKCSGLLEVGQDHVTALKVRYTLSLVYK